MPINVPQSVFDKYFDVIDSTFNIFGVMCQLVSIQKVEKIVYNPNNNIPDRNTINELKTYVRNERGTMSGSPFDDRVMALALSNQMRQYAFMPEYAPAADDYWTVDWFKNLVLSEKESPSTRIGSKTVRGTV